MIPLKLYVVFIGVLFEMYFLLSITIFEMYFLLSIILLMFVTVIDYIWC